MEKLSKKQRHQLYKDALNSLEKEDNVRLGLCWAFGSVGCYDGYDTEFSNLPEIYCKKPDGAYGKWFSQDLDGKDSRIELLKKAILETK